MTYNVFGGTLNLLYLSMYLQYYDHQAFYLTCASVGCLSLCDVIHSSLRHVLCGVRGEYCDVFDTRRSELLFICTLLTS